MEKYLVSATPAITLDEAKANARVDHDFENAEIDDMIVAAGLLVEAQANRQFGPNTWDCRLDTFPHYTLKLPVTDVVSVTSIDYTDPAGEAAVMDPAGVKVHADGDITPIAAYWPDTAAPAGDIVMRVTAGRGWPETARRAVRLIVGHWIANRETTAKDLQEIPLGATALISSFRRPCA